METVNYPKRNQKSAKSVLAGAEFKSGKNQAGKNVIVVNGTACAASDFAMDIIHNEKWNELDKVQYFEFEVNGTWIPVFCKAGGELAGQKVHTLPSDLR